MYDPSGVYHYSPLPPRVRNYEYPSTASNSTSSSLYRPSAHSFSYAPKRSTSGTMLASASTTPTITPSSSAAQRRARYTRSSTTASVTQILSDSCSSLLQKLSTKVRGPSEHSSRNKTPTNSYSIPLSTSASTSYVTNNNNNATKRIDEDKYFSVWDRIYGRKKEERTLEPSIGRGLTLSKSATTANVPTRETPREKTPYKTPAGASTINLDSNYLDRHVESIYNSSHRLNAATSATKCRPRRSAKPQRDSQTIEKKLAAAEMKIVDISIDDPLSERETKRKEIQSLIMKYSALDEVYNRVGSSNDAVAAAGVAGSTIAASASSASLNLKSSSSNSTHAINDNAVAGRYSSYYRQSKARAGAAAVSTWPRVFLSISVYTPCITERRVCVASN